MDKETRARLESAGYWIGDAEEWLGLSEEERRMVELRVKVSRLVRSLRERHGLTQLQLAKKMKSSQSRVAKIEAGEADVSRSEVHTSEVQSNREVVFRLVLEKNIELQEIIHIDSAFDALV